MRQLGILAIAAATGFAGVYGFAPRDTGNGPLVAFASCVIKGNVSMNSGEHIYHVPGQEFYAATRIDPSYGERWFCSEADARAAGWRRAKR